MATIPFRLDGKTILITGASSGIGRQTAVSCAKMGARLVITGRNRERLKATLAALKEADHRSFAADLTVAEDLHALVDACGKIDGVFHSVGISGVTPIKLVSEKFLVQVFASNYFAPVLLTQRLLYKNALNRDSSIVFVASTSAHLGVHGVGPYSGTKGALLATMRCIALEQARNGIRCNCLSPDLVETPLLTDSGSVESTREWLEAQRKRHPLGLGTPEDIANAAIYFLSDASRWVTGVTLIMDGGVTY